MLSTHTFADDEGVNTTRPSNMSVHPKNLAEVPHTWPQFEYVRAVGSIMTTLDASAGVQMIFPDGKRHAP